MKSDDVLQLATKGDWTVNMCQQTFPRIKRDNKILADCFTFSEGITDEEAEANARLMANSKNMYILLKKAYNQLEWIKTGQAGELMKEFNDLLQQINTIPVK